jgi:hypothetical protein
VRGAVLAATLLLIASSANAQSVRGSVTNIGRYIQIRPIARDTVDSAQVVTAPDGSLEFEGRRVFCSAGTCTFYRPADIQHALTTAHDLSATAWGLGAEGLSATVLLRVRTDADGSFTWPRSDDAFDAMLAYADYAREKYRVRLGRQRTASGLGFYSFDGIDARYDVTSLVSIEAYGGRSLARGLEEPRHTALNAVESFLPDQNAWLVGGAAELNYDASAVALRYQRELWGDRSGLVSERASLDFTTGILRPLQLEGAADYDIAFKRLGKAHLKARLPLEGGKYNIELTGRRYLPFFELWTIWGVFSPIAYHEAELQANAALLPRLGVTASASFRKYEDADAPVFLSGPEDDAQLFTLRARFDATESFALDGEVRFENSFGAYLGSGEVNGTWSPSERLRATAYLTAFQQILEFRTGEAAVVGLGGSLDFELTRDIVFGGGGTVYLAPGSHCSGASAAIPESGYEAAARIGCGRPDERRRCFRGDAPGSLSPPTARAPVSAMHGLP